MFKLYLFTEKPAYIDTATTANKCRFKCDVNISDQLRDNREKVWGQTKVGLIMNDSNLLLTDWLNKWHFISLAKKGVINRQLDRGMGFYWSESM